MLVNTGLLLLGFGLIIKGADFLVDGSSSLAKRYNVSELTIGLTIVAFGTSAPELVVNIIAAIKNYDNVSLGNIIGSNIFNLFLILGFAGLIYPIVVQSKTVWKEIPLSLFAGIILLFLANDAWFAKSAKDTIKWYDGIILLSVFSLFIYYAFRNLRAESDLKADLIKVFGLGRTILYITIGFVFLIFGGKMVVNNAVELAKFLHVNEKIIGLTIVATGTSLPELATSAVAAFKKRSDLAIGNVIGSNIFNILFILGITSLIRPLHYSISFNLDIGIYLLGTTFLFIAMFTGKKKRLDRWEALILFSGYFVYIFYLIIDALKQ